MMQNKRSIGEGGSRKNLKIPFEPFETIESLPLASAKLEIHYPIQHRCGRVVKPQRFESCEVYSRGFQPRRWNH